MTILINSLHIGLFAPALLLLAWYPKWNTTMARSLLALVALAVVWYHGKKAVASHGWVSWFHVAVVAPLLFLLAWQGTKLAPGVKQATVFIAMGAIAYHTYRLV